MRLEKDVYVMGTFKVKDSNGKEFTLWELTKLKRSSLHDDYKEEVPLKRTLRQMLPTDVEDSKPAKRQSRRTYTEFIDDEIELL